MTVWVFFQAKNWLYNTTYVFLPADYTEEELIERALQNKPGPSCLRHIISRKSPWFKRLCSTLTSDSWMSCGLHFTAPGGTGGSAFRRLTLSIEAKAQRVRMSENVVFSPEEGPWLFVRLSSKISDSQAKAFAMRTNGLPYNKHGYLWNFVPRLMRWAFEPPPPAASDAPKSYFCSQLVAEFLVQYGVLPKESVSESNPPSPQQLLALLGTHFKDIRKHQFTLGPPENPFDFKPVGPQGD